MYRILYFIINLIARIHAKLLSINDNRGLGLTDKQLHFLIIGVFGFAMMMVVQPVFEWLTKHNATLIVSFLYVLTVVTVVSLPVSAVVSEVSVVSSVSAVNVPV